MKVGQTFYIMSYTNLMDKTNFIAHEFVCTEIIKRQNLTDWIEHKGGGADSKLCYPDLDSIKNKLRKLQERKKVILKGKIKELEEQIDNISKYEIEIRK